MKKIILILLLAAPLFIFSQEKGVNFQHELSWQQVLAKAKAENKYIFMDCFTTWCGPCKYMSANIFPKEDVGNLLNEKFISVKVQLDKTENDDEHVKQWYDDGEQIAKKYEVQVYPTYLFFDNNGNAVHRAVGAMPAENFITLAQNALDPSKQYYTLLHQYEQGKKEPEFLKRLASAAFDCYDENNGKKVFDEYIATQTDLYTKENLELFSKVTRSTNDKGFDVFIKNPQKVNEVLGKPHFAENLVTNIILQQKIFSKLNPNGPAPDWSNIGADIKSNYPTVADEVTAKAKVIYYQFKKDWPHFQTAIVTYMDKFGSHVSPEELNTYAWNVFENCSDMKCVELALEWSKRSFEGSNNPAFMDTYANILYRLGKKDEAIVWEEKALSLAPDNEKQTYQETLDKMKKGEKTWN